MARTTKKAAAGKGATRKLFVLDTNVLMHDPSSLFRFEEHDIFLPMMTLEELDNHKKAPRKLPAMRARPRACWMSCWPVMIPRSTTASN